MLPQAPEYKIKFETIKQFVSDMSHADGWLCLQIMI
jgi:hypothetical protein